MPESKVPRLTARFEDALVYATRLHAQQVRKGSGIPYVTHLLSVAALVLENGGDEDEAIAALLHDAVEDQGGRTIREQIRERFGERVAQIIDGCSDTDVVPKPPWRERKERHIAHLRHAPPEVRRIVLADKLHNARTILADWRQVGDAIWDRFRGGQTGTLWYYRAITDALRATEPEALTSELDRVVSELEMLVKGDSAKAVPGQ